MALSFLLWALAVLLVVAGLAGIVLPAFPGALLLLAGLVAGAWADHFVHVGGGTLAVLGALTLLIYVLDFLAAALGARRFGASNRAVLGAAVGAIAGIPFGLPGIVLGPFLGAVLGEVSAHGDLLRAGRAGFGAWVGLVLGVALKLAVAFTMVGVFVVARFF